jgi:thymidylate synthase
MSDDFEYAYKELAGRLLRQGARVVEPPHQMSHLRDDPKWTTVELLNEILDYPIPVTISELQHEVKPNLPWAEEHFQERVSGEPLNPPPSHERWPYAQSSNQDHMEGGKFSHTYPERMWPKEAGDGGNQGLRYALGDLNDLVELLAEKPLTRQAYLPIWFPEDLTAAKWSLRVPCTLGYHFMAREGKLDITYFIRSCDFVRYFRDDVYMACRLAQWVVDELQAPHVIPIGLVPGTLTMHTVSMHCFAGDLDGLRWRYA